MDIQINLSGKPQNFSIENGGKLYSFVVEPCNGDEGVFLDLCGDFSVGIKQTSDAHEAAKCSYVKNCTTTTTQPNGLVKKVVTTKRKLSKAK